MSALNTMSKHDQFYEMAMDPKPSAHGSGSLDEVKARMRDVGYEEWEIEEEIEEASSSYKANEERTKQIQEGLKMSEEQRKPWELVVDIDEFVVLPDKFEAYEDNAGYRHLFAIDTHDKVLRSGLFDPASQAEATAYIAKLKNDPTLWLGWESSETLDYDPDEDLAQCRAWSVDGKGSCEELCEWKVDLKLASEKIISARSEGMDAIAAATARYEVSNGKFLSKKEATR